MIGRLLPGKRGRLKKEVKQLLSGQVCPKSVISDIVSKTVISCDVCILFPACC